MKLAIIGSRAINNYEAIKESVLSLVNILDVVMIVSGGANGVDRLAEKLADEYLIPKLIFKAEWQKYGKQAGMLRNSDIIKNADTVIAFWDGKSSGTKHSIGLARQYKKSLFVVKM